MEITIRAAAGSPPHGWLRAGDEAEQPFSSWLDLLRILAELLRDSEPPPDAPAPETRGR